MHELAITQSLVEQIQELTDKPLKAVSLELGELTSYKGEAIEFYFKKITEKDKQFSNTTLNIKRITGVLQCLDCHKETEMDGQFNVLCPHCDSENTEILQGRDLKITKVEVE